MAWNPDNPPISKDENSVAVTQSIVPESPRDPPILSSALSQKFHMVDTTVTYVYFIILHIFFSNFYRLLRPNLTLLSFVRWIR
jgi:hypothetical protein